MQIMYLALHYVCKHKSRHAKLRMLLTDYTKKHRGVKYHCLEYGLGRT